MTPRIIGLGKKAFDNSVVTISVYVQTAENVLQFKSSKGANNSVRYSSYGPNVGDPIIDTRVHFDNVDTPVTLALNPTARRELEDAAERAAASFDANTSVEVQIIKAFGCPQ